MAKKTLLKTAASAEISEIAEAGASHQLKKHYGHISTKLYHYFTPLMVFTTLALYYLVLSHYGVIKGYFMHGVVLNSMMLVIVHVGIYMAYMGNFSILRTAKFLTRVEKLLDKGSASADEVHKLRVSLEREANLLSMANFSVALGHLQTYGHLNLNDNEARLIKSKFGARVSHIRTKVNYFCGILVMLGLIGTFWGLLDTINSVGKAMTMVADNFAAQSNTGAGGAEIDMGGFLGSISKPLEGMGAGFSASLFGLGGSLFLGFLNYLSGFAHNHFMEHFSRWIDDRIPSMSTGLSNKVKSLKVPEGDDLKAWLAGFVYLSNKTNHRMGQLFTAFIEANENTNRSIQQIEKLYTHQQSVLNAIEDGNQKIGGLHSALKTFASDIVPSHLALQKIRDSVDHLTAAIDTQNKTHHKTMQDLQQTFKAMASDHASGQATLGMINDGMGRLSDSVSHQSNTQQKMINSQMDHLVAMFGQIQNHAASFAQIGEVQSGLLQEVRQLKHAPHPSTQTTAPEISNLVLQVNALLSELNQSGEDNVEAIFRRKDIKQVFETTDEL